MQFSSYNDFRAKTQQMFDGDDISSSDISVAVLDLIIGAGEQRIYREVRSSAMDAAFSLVVGTYAPQLFSGTLTAATFPSTAVGYDASDGTLSTPTDTLGTTVLAIAETSSASLQPFTVQLRGASRQNLGASYFSSITVSGGSVNQTLQTSAAAYSFSSGIAQWLFTGVILGLVAGDSYSISLNLSVSGTTNTATLPEDFIELKQGPYVNGYVQATYAPTEAFQNVGALDPRTGTHPIRYTFFGDTLQFYPALADGSTVTGRYYRRFPDISTGLNAFFTRWPDLFLYASLAESAPFIGEAIRGPVWETKYKEILQTVNETERRRISRGSKLQTRLA